MNAPKTFPPVKRSYETFIHKKVSQPMDIILAIPQGKRCFAWFTVNEKGEKSCSLMILSRYKKGQPQTFENIRQVKVSVKEDLYKGTVVYGTTFHFKKSLFFAAEDVLQYKSVDLSGIKNVDKLYKLFDIFNQDIQQVSVSGSVSETDVIFGIPIMKNKFEEFGDIPYRVSHYQYMAFSANNRVNCINSPDSNLKTLECEVESASSKNLHDIPKQEVHVEIKDVVSQSKPHVYERNLERKKTMIFTVTPDIQNDIYHLRNDTTQIQEIAYIPDYKTSVMMNRIFRNIKENINLDALEESDSEEEFENENLDKFVHLDKCERMVCAYNYKFKKWVPLRLEY